MQRKVGRAVKVWNRVLFELHTQMPHEEFHVFPHQLFSFGVAQQVGGVVGAEHFGGAVFEELAAKFGDGSGDAEQILSGDGTEADDEFRINDSDLRIEEFAAVGSFLGKRSPVAGRSAAEDIADIELFATKLTGSDDFVQQLSGRADERFAGFIFFLAGCFTKKHNSRRDTADPENSLLAAASQLCTALTGGDGVAEATHCSFPRVRRVQWPGEHC